MSLSQRLTKARMTLLLDFPFWGQLAMRLAPEIRPGCGTAETDGKVVAFDPDFCATLNDRQLVWLYAHEVSHPALGHPWRIGSRDLGKCRRAADYAVNEMLEGVIKNQPGAAARMERIPRTLLDPQYFGMSMEEIYSILPDEPADGTANPGGGPRAVGNFSKPAPSPATGREAGDGDGAGEDASAALEQEWKQAVQEAATVARMKNRGVLPSNVEDLIKELVEPAVPWQDILRQFASRVSRDDYGWNRPNRRYLQSGFILPTLHSHSLGPLAVAVDTSGSIRCSKALLTKFLSELQGILDLTRPEILHLMDCDARVHQVREFRPGDDLRDQSFRGGGGTRFEPVFNEVESREIHPAALVYFTDLEGSFPPVHPPYPVLWLNYGNPRKKAPFGETVAVLPS